MTMNGLGKPKYIPSKSKLAFLSGATNLQNNNVDMQSSENGPGNGTARNERIDKSQDHDAEDEKSISSNDEDHLGFDGSGVLPKLQFNQKKATNHNNS